MSTVTTAKEKGTSWVSCFTLRNGHSVRLQQAGNFCRFQLEGRNLLQIKAIMEKADAVGKYFDSVFHLKAASMLGGGERFL